MPDDDVLRSNLLALARCFAKATRTSLPAVSRRFYGNVGFFGSFAKKKTSITIDKYIAVVEAIRGAWPPEAEWPYLRPYIIEPPQRG